MNNINFSMGTVKLNDRATKGNSHAFTCMLQQSLDYCDISKVIIGKMIMFTKNNTIRFSRFGDYMYTCTHVHLAHVLYSMHF